MLSIAIYALQVIICSGIMMLYYWLVLRNKRFHRYNRFYILSVFILSWLIPLGKIYLFDINKKPVPRFIYFVANGNDYMDEVVVRSGFHVNWWSVATIAYILICLAFVAVFVKAIVFVFRLQKKNPKEFVHNFWLVLTDAAGTPFSFFKYVFWNKAVDINSSTGKQMLEHELVHVNEKHSLDSVFVQIILCAGWFNPFFWLAKKELDMIHEFIADKKSVENGDTAAFAAMLLTAAYPQQQHLLTNSFFFSSIKRRLNMLTQNKNPKFSYMRRIVILPLMAVVVLLFAFRIDKTKNEKELARAKTLNAILDSKLLDTVPKKIDSTIASLTDTIAEGKDSAVRDNLKNNDSIKFNANKALIIVDGVKYNHELSKLDPKDIESISVIKEKSAATIYGDAAKDGVILIQTKKQNNQTVKIPRSFTAPDENFVISNNEGNLSLSVYNRWGNLVYQNGNYNNNWNGTGNQAEFNGKELEAGTYYIVTTNGKGKTYSYYITINRKEQYDKVFTVTQTPASFPGGAAAWQKYLERNLHSDIPVMKGAPVGKYTVIVSFIVDKEGNISDVKNENNPGYGTAEEAVRIIEKGPKWVPATQNGIKVTCRHRQSITYKISTD